MEKEKNNITEKTISVVVDNTSGVLARVSNLFSRRGYNIESLAVGITENPELSRITIVVSCDGRTLEQIVSQLEKLVCVHKVKVLSDNSKVMRELVLIKVKADPAKRSEIIEIANIFRCRIIDLTPSTLTLEVTGEDGKTTALLDMIKDYGIIELARTGIVALDRGISNINE